jgi:choline dehydrogenase-like flavoprotein
VSVLGKLTLTDKALRREKLLNHNIQLVPWDFLDPFKYKVPRPTAVESWKTLASAIKGQKVQGAWQHLRNIVTGLDDIAAASVRKARHVLFGVPKVRLYIFANMTEQIPDPESRITLGSERDLFGQQRLQLNWKLAPQDIRSAKRTQELIASALERIGLGRYFQELKDETPPSNTEGGYHHMGTTRMHDDPKQGVVDKNCQVHGIDNLHIAGPSVFPTVGYANPILTFVALTLRLADRIKEQMR